MSTNQEILLHSEVLPPLSDGEEQAANSVEVPTPKEKDVRQPAVMATPPQNEPPAGPVLPVAPSVPDPSSTQVHSGATGAIADDVDLIEKEWVDRAKAIVDSTQDDPRKQKNEISKVKAEYIQKRFNKTIKVDSAT
jgi:type IV secretory pathway VirB10-like protein